MSVLANRDLDKTKVRDTAVEPEDIYLLIGNRVRPGVDRDVWKKPIMTLPYGSNKHSWVWQLFSVESQDNPGTYMFTLEECWQIARKLELEIKRELPWAVDLLKLFRSLGQRAESAISWQVPAGYSVEQYYRAFEYRKCASKLHGGVTTTLYSVQKDDPARRANAKALTPNIIHSLDASLLCSFTREWDGPISVAHDRFSTSSFRLSDLYQQLQHNAEVMLNRPDFLKTLVADITGDDSYELPFDVPEYERWNISPYFYSF
jgi:DNA-directed RNA polymerase